MKASSLTTATPAELGKWFEYEGGLRLLIAADQNKSHVRFLAGRGRKLRKDELKDIDKLLELDNEALVECIFLGWEGLVEDDEKTPVPYNKKLALLLVSGPSLAARQLRHYIVASSKNAEAFALEDKPTREEAAAAAATFPSPA